MESPQYPIQVEGWRGAISHDELESLGPQTSIEKLIESAYPPAPAEWHPQTNQYEHFS